MRPPLALACALLAAALPRAPATTRAVAEWDPMRGVLVRYPFGVPMELLRLAAETAVVYCLVADATTQLVAASAMEAGGVDTAAHVQFILGPTDSYWTRDYGPWWWAEGDGTVGIVDFEYNRPRPNDNDVPRRVSEYLQVPYRDAGIVAVGGNYMTDGVGGAASAHIAYTENAPCNTNDETSVPLAPCPHVDDAMRTHMGVDAFHVVADPTGSYIDHIDTFAKFLSPTVIMVCVVPPWHAQHAAIEAVAVYFTNHYDVVRVQTPNGEPYTNSLILNGRVYVPVMEADAALDAQAIQAYESAMPGYAVVGVPASPQAPWLSTDALHCRTRGIPCLGVVDYNGDGVLNIFDVVAIVGCILSGECVSLAGDFNCDRVVDVFDLVKLVRRILDGA